MNQDYMEKVAVMALEAGLGKKADVEIYLTVNRQLSIEVEKGAVDTLKEAEETGLGIRLIKDGSLGFAYTTDLSMSAVNKTVEDAFHMTVYTSSDNYNQLPSGPYEYQNMQLYDGEIESTPVGSKIELACRAETAARETDGRISIIERAGYEDVENTTLIMNSNGLYARERVNFGGLYIYLAAEDNGDAQTGFAVQMSKWFKDLNPLKVGREAAEKAVGRLHARSISSAVLPCIMEPYVMTRFLNIISRMVNAEAVQKGKSLLVGKLGQKVAAGCMTLVDDATRTEGTACFPFDDEGVPVHCQPIIKEGVLNSYLHNTYTAAREGINSTGNASRASFRSLPAVGSSNLVLLPGEKSTAALMDGINKGLYITEVMGMHTVNPISGDYSVGASGIMIEKGCLTFPVRGITIAGNIMDLLQSIDGVGSDMRFYGSRASASIRLKSINISG